MDNSTTVAPAGVVRASNFTIYVDLPNDPEHVLLVHGYSGAFDRVSADVARYVRARDVRPPKPLYGQWSYEPVADARTPDDHVIDLLTKRGYLTVLSADDERARFERIVAAKHTKTMTRVPSYLFMPTYDCNLRCSYCFQDHMRTDARFTRLLRTMTPSIVDRIVGTMPAIEKRHGLAEDHGLRRHVTFFGGEPLLAQSRPVVQYIMDSVRSIGPAVFSAVTNATELDAYDGLLGQDGLASLQITIDGPRAAHDSRRIYADGSGSFDRIVGNVHRALAAGTSVDVRLNVDALNIADLPELAECFEAEGWLDHPRFSAYAAPVHATNGKTEKKTTLNSHELSEAIKAMAEGTPVLSRMARPDDALRRRLRKLFRDGADPMTAMMRESYCGAHSGMYIFDAFADIYACWERTGDSNIRVGWIEPDGKVEFVADRLASWQNRTVTTNDTCGRCRYSMYCGGGCAVLAEGIHGTMYANYCDAFARRFRQTVAEVFTEPRVDGDIDENILELRAL